MWLQSPKVSNFGKRSGRNGLVAVAIDKDKGSQQALRWATENLLNKGQTIILIHVQKSSSSSYGNGYAFYNLNRSANAHKQALEKQTKELFVSYHCFCTRKDINCFDVVLEDTDVAKAITEYVATAAIENLVLGASRHGFIRRLKMVDIPSSVSKLAPDFCTVYVISKTKISSVKNASRLAPFVSPLKNQIRQVEEQTNGITPSPHALPKHASSIRGLRKSVVDDTELVKLKKHMEKATGQKASTPLSKWGSPFSRGKGYNSKMFSDLSELESDISFISSERPSTDRISTDRLSGILFDSLDSCRTSRVSTSSDSSAGSIRSGARGSDFSSFTDFSSSSLESDDVDAEMRRLKLELQRTMEMYSTACKEALSAKQKAVELHRWRMEEERRLEEARLTEESARLTAEQEKAKYKAAMENAQAAQRIAEIESQKRLSAVKALQESDEKEKSMSFSTIRYRRYSIEEIEKATEYFAESRKVGEGGYGPVYRCYLDHTPVAVKVLRPDAAQGRSQFQREVEVLSCMRHPHMVLLLGACPEYGCLVYEYMANGSLEDRLFRRGNTRPLTWQLRFKIAAEIATGLLFLHQTKPEPLVHRDLKPGNILLDSNYVSKISDVGLARLVPPSVADDVTQYRMTSTAGTFCYIDPEYQQTGMLGVKSDVYSLGVMLLQIITAKSAMGLTHHVDRAIEKGAFAEMLDPTVPDWPMVEALAFAKLALQCAELRRKDRPDLGKVVLSELNRLREFAEDNMTQFVVGGNRGPSPPIRVAASADDKVTKSDPQVQFEYSNPVACVSSASLPENLASNDQEDEIPGPETASINDQEQEAPPPENALVNDQELETPSPEDPLSNNDQEQEASPIEDPSSNDQEEAPSPTEDPSSNDQEQDAPPPESASINDQEEEVPLPEDPSSNDQEQEAPLPEDPSSNDQEEEAPPPENASVNDQEQEASPPEDPSSNDQEEEAPPPENASVNDQEQESLPPEDPSSNDQEQEASLPEDPSSNDQEQEAPLSEDLTSNDQEIEAPTPENESVNDQEQEAPPPKDPSSNDQEQEAPPPEDPSSNDQEQEAPPLENLPGDDPEQETPSPENPPDNDPEQEVPPPENPSSDDPEQEAPPPENPPGDKPEEEAPPPENPSDQEQEAPPPENPPSDDPEQEAPPPENPPSDNPEQEAPPPKNPPGDDPEQEAPPPENPPGDNPKQEAPMLENPLGDDPAKDTPLPENPSSDDQEQEAPPPENPSGDNQEQEATPPENPPSDEQGDNPEQEAPLPKDPPGDDQEQEAPPPENPSGND